MNLHHVSSIFSIEKPQAAYTRKHRTANKTIIIPELANQHSTKPINKSKSEQRARTKPKEMFVHQLNEKVCWEGAVQGTKEH